MRRAIIVSLCLLAVAGACAIQGGNEGDRCNPNLSHDECDDGLTCQKPSTCAEHYCCPASLGSSKSSYCRGEACGDASVD
jgi:hypothetical protein